MIPFHLNLSKSQKIDLQVAFHCAEKDADHAKAKRLLSIMLLNFRHTIAEISDMLNVNEQTIRNWVSLYLLKGLNGLKSGKSPGRPSNLTKTQRKELAALVNQGSEKSGFPGACWRTPMLQTLIQSKFGVYYNVRYISELLKNMGFSFQKAKFLASKQDKVAREEWVEKTWPEILSRGRDKNAFILFGDEASFPQWGSLNYTWAPIGTQPVVKTSGSRRGYKVFGLIDYFTGRFFSKGHEGKLNAESYIDFLQSVLSTTRKHILLVQDGAPYHCCKAVREFFAKNKHRLTVYQLPTYSPDFNPIEGLWKKIKQNGTHLKFFPTFDSLKETVNEMTAIFQNAKHEVLSLFGFYSKMAEA